MAVTPKYLTLTEGERLSDRPPRLQGQRILLEGETNIGKTYYVLHYLAPRHPLLLLLPTVAQVQQLEKTETATAPPISFVHSTSQPDQLCSTIVATYDQLDRLITRLGTDEIARRWLVIDEIHKLYQAGNYRANALERLLIAIDTIGQTGGFARLLGLSATIQPELLDFPIDQWIRVRTPAGVTRQITIVEYESFTIPLWLQTLRRQMLLPRDRLNVVRLNDTKRLEELARTFEIDGYCCLVVHSQKRDEDDVQQMLASQEVAEADLLLTTSLLDEGINIQNPNLGVVHLYGPVHSAELRQFLGRFRQSNPRLYLHIPRLPEAGHRIDIEQRRADQQAALDLLEGHCIQLLKYYERQQGSLPIPEIITYVKRLNATHRRFLDMAPLLYRRRQEVREDGTYDVIDIMPNRPGLLAQLYQFDTDNHYQSRTGLQDRLRQQLGDCTIVVERVAEETPDAVILNALQAGSALQQEQRTALIETIEQRLDEAIATGVASNPMGALLHVVRQVGPVQTEEAGLLRMVELLAARVVVDVPTALTIVRANRQQAVWQFVQGLDDRLIVTFHTVLAEYREEVAPGSQTPLRIPRETGHALVMETLMRLSQRHPDYQLSALLLGSKRRGVTRDLAGNYEVTAQFVTKLFRDYTDSDIDRRYYRFRGVSWGGYHYHRLPAPPPRPVSAVMPARHVRA